MPPVERPIPRFIAEPSQEGLPYGRWADALAAHFLAAAARIEADEDIGDAGEIAWFPDRTWAGRVYVPTTAPTSNGYELFGYVSFARVGDEEEPRDFHAVADFTDETAEANPDWALDLSDQEIGAWRGPQGRRGEITLIWGVALVQNGAIATAELGPTTTDQCELVDNRFTLVSLDNYTGDYVEVKLYGRGGGELASESLYEDEE
jgi:hypothetical protein